MNKINNYRSDIDGLRAVAIVSVILFHLDKLLLPGGFTGVDIFFVISGFLITTHIVKDKLRGTFTFQKFYMRRIKRIIPALLGVVLFVLFGSFFIFTQYSFQKTGMEAISAILSFSNIYFFTTAGYFDDNVIFKPLLHTWSLGVEEQFYLLWPMVIVLFLNFIRFKKIVWLFLIVGISSFVLNYLFLSSKEAIFFLVFFRIFEFTVGAFVAYIILNQKENSKVKYSNSLSMIGIILILFPLFLLDETVVFPFYNALPTIIGTGLIIYSKEGYINKVLSLKLFVWIGLISYSLYLYHWPIIVFVSYLNNSMLDSSLYVYIGILTVIMALLSYFFVENKFRYMENKKSISWIMVTAILLLIFSVFSTRGDIKSMSTRHFELITPEAFKKAQNRRWSFVANGCTAQVVNDRKRCKMKAPLQIMTLGDSHAIDGYNIISSIIHNDPDINLIHFRTVTGCGYTLKNKQLISATGECNKEAKLLNDASFIEQMDVLVVDFFKYKAWAANSLWLIDYIREKKSNIKIILIGGYLGVRPNNCFDLINKKGTYGACSDPRNVTYTGNEDYDWIMSKNFTKENFLYIDTLYLLCGKSKEMQNCLIKLENELVFYDGDHFSLDGATLVGVKAMDAYKNKMKEFKIKVKP